MSTTTTDRIEKQILLQAPRSRVWRAIADSKEFGDWFQAVFDGPFTPGAVLNARLTYPGYEHITMQVTIEQVVPERLLSYRWHPDAADPTADFSAEPTTLVEFRLADAEGGTLLTITESGFDRIPAARRAKALRSNDGGWTMQIKAVERHVRERA